MAKLCEGMRASIRFIEDVERCLSDACIKFDSVTLHPWSSDGGRSKGVSGEFIYKNDGRYKALNIVAFEHWNSDCLDLQFNPCCRTPGTEKHDMPDIQFTCGIDGYKLAVLYAQMYLLGYMKIDFPKESYVPHFGGLCDGISAATEEQLGKVYDLLYEHGVEGFEEEE